MAPEKDTPKLLVGHVAALAKRFENLTRSLERGVRRHPLASMMHELSAWLEEDVDTPRWAVWWESEALQDTVVDATFGGAWSADGERVHDVAAFRERILPRLRLKIEENREVIRELAKDDPTGFVTPDGLTLASSKTGVHGKPARVWIALEAADTRTENVVLLSRTLQGLVGAVARQANLAAKSEKYSERGFRRNADRLAKNTGILGEVAHRGSREMLRLFAEQFLSHIRDTFGGDASAADGGKSAALKLWADLVHIRSALFRAGELKALRDLRLGKKAHLWERLMPAPMGDLLPREARPWAELVAETLLLRAVRDAPDLETILADWTFLKRLAELGWNTRDLAESSLRMRKRFAKRLASDLLRIGVRRRYGRDGTDVPTFWRLEDLRKPPVAADPTPALRRNLDVLLTRWMLLDVLFEIELFEIELLGEPLLEGPLGRLLPRLWTETRVFCRRWLLLHRQWSTLHGPDVACAAEARKEALGWWNRDGSTGGAGRSHENDGNSAHRLAVHIDPIWTNLYLLSLVLEHFEPEQSGNGRWARLRSEIRNEAAQRELLRSVARVAAFVLWNLALQEEDPERFCFVELQEEREPDAADEVAGRTPGSGDGNDTAATAGAPRTPQLFPFHQPVGAEPYAEALIRLMEAFGHHVLKVDPAVDIRGSLRRALESEPLLHAASDYYRDHLYHLVDLCLLGDFLLTARVDTRSGHLWRALFPPTAAGGGFSQPYRLDGLRRQWFVAAVFHDVGYLFTLLAGAPRHLRDQQMAASHQEFVDALEHALRGAVEALEERISAIARHLERSRPGLDRGVHSAVMLRDHLLAAVPATAGEGHRLVRSYLPALRAICQHNLPAEEVRQDCDPLSFLMVVCDELQDWARTRVQLPELKRHTVFRTADDANWQERRIPVLTELVLPVSGVRDGDIVLGLDTASRTAGQPGARRRTLRIPFVQIYAPDEIGYLNPIYLWVLRAQNLQRLRRYERGDVVLDLEIHTVTRIPQRLHKARLTFRKALAEIAADRGDLGLENLVDHLDRTLAGAIHPLGGTAPPAGKGTERNMWSGWWHVRDDCTGRQRESLELQVFDVAALQKARPVRGYPREKDVAELAEAYQQYLTTRESQRRLLKLELSRRTWEGP